MGFRRAAIPQEASEADMYRLKTANNYDLGECVSALQKCIRRGHIEEALFFAAELETRFPDYLWKRLITIVNEDIGLASPETIILVDVLWRQYEHLRRHAHGPSERLCLTNAIVAMCQAKKTRLADDLQAVIYRQREWEGRRMPVPDFALDKHTARGRAQGRSEDHWWDEGTQLSNEAPGLNVWADRARAIRRRHPKPKVKPAAKR